MKAHLAHEIAQDHAECRIILHHQNESRAGSERLAVVLYRCRPHRGRWLPDGLAFDHARSGAVGSGARDGQSQSEYAAGAGCALHGNRASQQGRQIAGDRQAQSGAAELAVNAAVGLAECLEYHCLLMGGYADAGIAHCEVHRARFRGKDPQAHFAMFSELDRIRQQILEYLPQALRISVDFRGHSRLDGRRKAQPLLLGFRLKRLQQSLDDLRH